MLLAKHSVHGLLGRLQLSTCKLHQVYKLDNHITLCSGLTQWDLLCNPTAIPCMLQGAYS